MKNDPVRPESEEDWANQWCLAEDHIFRLGAQYGQLLRVGAEAAEKVKDAADAFIAQFSCLEVAPWQALKASLEFTFGVASDRPFQFKLPEASDGKDTVPNVRLAPDFIPRPRTPMVETEIGAQVQV